MCGPSEPFSAYAHMRTIASIARTSTRRTGVEPTEPAWPLVSVIMPAYNAGPYLRGAVESILGQTYRNLELILIDDGSTDGSIAALADIDDPRLRRVSQPNRGKPAAMNRGLALANGSFYALQDADDLSHPTRLERQAHTLMAHPDVAGVFCGHELIVDDRRVAPLFRSKSVKECADAVAKGCMPAHDPTAMYRLSLVGGVRYAEDLPIVEGLDYVLRVGEQFPLLVLGECLYQYRVHSRSVTKRLVEERIRLSQELFDRMHDRRKLPRRRMSGWGNPARDGDNDIVSHFTASVADLVLAERRGAAIRAGLVSWRMHPLQPYYVKPLIYAFTPRVLMQLYHSIKAGKNGGPSIAKLASSWFARSRGR